MTFFIHESALISPNAKIGGNCHIGAYSNIGDEVVLGDGVHLESHVVIDGKTSIGDETRIFPFVSIGLAPQDLKYAGEPTATEIGKRNHIREFVTNSSRHERRRRFDAHRRRQFIDGAGARRARIANSEMKLLWQTPQRLPVTSKIADRANIGAYSGVHQFCRIGLEAFVGGYSVVVKDALPFATIQGNHAKCFGINRVGMKRTRLSERTQFPNWHHAFHLLLTSKLNTGQAVEKIKEEIKDCAEVDLLVDFIKTSKRGVVK